MKIKTFLAAGILLLAGIVSAAQLQRFEWTIDGVARQALVWIPDVAPTNGCPLVFAFHGHGGNMQNAARSFRIHELWPEAAVVYMQGLPTPGQLTDPEGKRNGWNAKPDDPDNRDLKFFDAVLSRLQKETQIDSKQIYSTGHSNGGSFTYCLWAARGDLFAAMAPSGSAAGKSVRRLPPKPVLHVAGKTDPLVKYSWQEKTISLLKQLNGCGGGIPWASSGDLTGTLYPSATCTPVVTLLYPGDHTFPREAPELIVRFFKENPRK